MPAISKKRRQSINFANNVIIRDASGIFRSKREVIDSKAATLIIIEDETENELSAYDIWHAQFCEEWRLLHEFSHDAEGEHSKANDVFDEDHFDDICKANA